MSFNHCCSLCNADRCEALHSKSFFLHRVVAGNPCVYTLWFDESTDSSLSVTITADFPLTAAGWDVRHDGGEEYSQVSYGTGKSLL